MNSANVKQFVIGLPGAGKTTFLAALWHVIASGEVAGALQLSHLAGDQTYLNRIRDAWADVLELERTKLGYEHTVSMVLRQPQSQANTEVVFPDLSGESFELQWTGRTMTEEFAVLLREAIGGLLFIHPTVRDETLIAEANALIDIVDASAANDDHRAIPENAPGDAAIVEEPRKWQARLAPTQIQLVDLLQFTEGFVTRRPLRLAVIISAWDLVPDTSPNGWIKQRLPLLHQYLACNRDVFAHQCFGISGQGGDLQTDADELRAIGEPSERIEVVTDNRAASCDITLPIRWIMNWS